MPEAVFLCAGGCGGFYTTLAELHERGIVFPRHYCDGCVVRADTYLEARDELHTRLALEFQEGLSALTVRMGFPKGKLPDQ